MKPYDPRYDHAIQEILECIQHCALSVQEILRSDTSHYLQSTNASGDMQLAVDVRADRLFEQELLKLACVQGVCSEEKPHALYKKARVDSGLDSSAAGSCVESPSLNPPHAPKSENTDQHSPLLIAYDPLDGSSLFDSNLSVGSIFGIYDGCFSAGAIIAAVYVVYGPRLELVLAHNELAHYAHNGTHWERRGNLALKQKGKLNAPGGTQQHWHKAHKNLIDSLFAQGYRLRYSGGMVPDLHQILCKGGGLFSYPATSDAPKGKLRKLFEVFPFALVYELAGGEAIDGQKRVLDLPCQDLHESTPCFLGSRDEIALVRATYANIK